MANKTVIKKLNWLLKQDSCKAKFYIEFALFVNSTKTTYKIGDVVKFSDPSTRVWDQRVEQKIGIVKDIRWLPQMYEGKGKEKFGFLYEIEATFFDGKTKYTGTYYIQNRSENRKIHKKLRKLKDNFIRHPIQPSNVGPESIDVAI